MTSGCYPGCINCIGSLAQDQITILGKRVEGSTATRRSGSCSEAHCSREESSGISSHSTGVVAVPRDVPKVLSLPGLMWGTFGTQSTDIR